MCCCRSGNDTFAAKTSHQSMRHGVAWENRQPSAAVVPGTTHLQPRQATRTRDMVCRGKIDSHMLLSFWERHICSQDKPPEHATWGGVGQLTPICSCRSGNDTFAAKTSHQNTRHGVPWENRPPSAAVVPGTTHLQPTQATRMHDKVWCGKIDT